MMFYFDNAATTQMSEVAIKALMDVSQNYYGNASSIYNYGRRSKAILTDAREIIAKSIGAKATEIFFTSCGTESDNWAVAQAKYTRVDDVITSKIEHHAVLNPVKQLKVDGTKTVFINVDENGIIDKRQLALLLNGKKQFVSVMFQNNETGMIQPIREIAELVHNSNQHSIFHTDAVQAVGHMHINVKELGVDMLSASAHKFNGPKGVGFLYAREDLPIFPLILGGGQEKTMRSGTENIAGIYSMAKALEENVMNIDTNITRIKSLENRLLCLLDTEDIRYMINGDVNGKAPGILNISFDGVDGEGLLNVLDAQGICVSIGSACNSESKERSYVLSAMGLNEERIDSSIRISIGILNTKEEVDKLANSIIRYIKLVDRINN